MTSAVVFGSKIIKQSEYKPEDTSDVEKRAFQL
jgi:hypothetical protein